MDFLAPGNILTLCISLFLVILFRQLDKNNRSIEKVKKFGDKLKAELEVFIKEKAAQLQESSLALDMQQEKAIAAVKRLDSIREDLLKKEAELLERTKSVANIEKHIVSYDQTIKELLEMTALAEGNLAKIRAESDFADSLGKKLNASQAQLQQISASVPALQDRFAKENREYLSTIHAETLSKTARTIAELEHKITQVHQNSGELLTHATEKMKELYQKAFTEASKKADALEDASFSKLKEQAMERLAKYRETVEEKTHTLHEHTKEKLIETQQLVKAFKAEWQDESSTLLETARTEMRALEDKSEQSLFVLDQKLKETNGITEARTKEMKEEIGRIEAVLGQSIGTFTKKAELSIATVSSSLDSRLDVYKQDVDYRLTQFDALLGDVERLDGQLRVSMQNTEKRVLDEFSLYAKDQQARQDGFEKKLSDEGESLALRMKTLESGLNELKARAYDNVSEKLKLFEDDFFADLAKRSDAITAALTNWKGNVDVRLDALSAESESGRKDIEGAYTQELKDRLAEIGELYRTQTSKLDEQMTSVEAELRARIKASDQTILSFVEQFRLEFAQARQTAELHVQNELGSHAITVQELLRKQEREVDVRTKEFINSIETAKSEAETMLEAIRTGFSSWQTKNEQQLAEAKALFVDKISAFANTTTASITDLDASYKTNYRDFVAQTAAERKLLKDGLEAIKKELSTANAEFDKRSAESIESFNRAYEIMAADKEKRIRETGVETDQTVKSLKTMVQELRDKLDQTQEKLFQKLQNDTNGLGSTLEDIDKKQKAFIAQTRIFDRADELKVTLETNIENLKNEISRLDVYRDTMRTLEQQYGKIKKLEEETGQKVTRFMTEKKRVDILEADFNKLLALSDSIDKKISELTLTNDDLQQYQVQIRRFEESVAEVNGRYERMEKKAVVLDQSANGIDKAFENLKTLEGALREYRENISNIPSELASIKNNIETLLENKEKTELTVEKLSSLDQILEDVEKRTDKMQNAREWLARTETRLEDISKQSQDQLKLLGDLIKEDGSSKKGKGAPPIGIRENVVKLAHQGWKVDEIARALHLSRGEVELILELPQK